MKKLIKVFLALISICSLNFQGFNHLQAATYPITAISEFVGMQFNLNGNHPCKLGYMYVNGELVYCIQPERLVIHGMLMVPGGDLNLQQQNAVSLIAHFGYSAKRMSDQWYAATQVLIWEKLGYHGTLSGFPDYANYRNQINADIANYQKKVSFNDKTFLCDGIDQISIKDTNNVLSSFKNISYDKNKLKVTRVGNSLNIKALTNLGGTTNISLTKKNASELRVPVVYRSQDNPVAQQVIRTSLNTNVKANVKIKVQPYGKLRFFKEGEVLNGFKESSCDYGKLYSFQFKKQQLTGVKAAIYAGEKIVDVNGKMIYAKDSLVETLTSNQNGVVSKPLISGNYYLKEIKALNDYVLDTKIYHFRVNGDEKAIKISDINLNNQRSKVTLKVNKTFEKHELISQDNVYKDVIFGIYNSEDLYAVDQKTILKKDSLVFVSGIDENGHLLNQPDLVLGKYYLKEMKTNENYGLDTNRYDFEVSGNNLEKIEVNINDGVIENKLIRNRLKVIKRDEKSNKPLIATFKLYDAKNNLIAKFKTQKDGTYVINDLVNGDYYLQEVEAPKGYVIDTKSYKLNIFGQDYIYTKYNHRTPIIRGSVGTGDSSGVEIQYSVMSVSGLLLLVIIRKWLVRKS